MNLSENNDKYYYSFIINGSSKLDNNPFTCVIYLLVHAAYDSGDQAGTSKL